MLKYFYLYSAVLFLTDFTVSVKTAYLKKPCEDFSEECLTKTLQMGLPIFVEGIREIGLESLDPYRIEKLNLKMPGDMNIEFKHGVARGLKKCRVDFARYKDHVFETQFHCNLTIKGHYRSVGRFLMFAIDGDGKSIIKCSNIRLHAFLTIKPMTGKDGMSHLEVTSSNFTHCYDGRVTYSVTNLLKGNPEISNAVVNFMNENWRMVAEDFGDPIVHYGISAVMKNLKKFFEVVPLEEII
ncbi:uncharacterized protein LOC114241797 [Bombyx mandarina]|uniref:Uncharacterized protein LOC114241797 n=1 Tax=Bombyx mandarina TaxID=7092 RepID=A0A6J2JHS9_BOMMA|nr:uncharacterized protein LOC114241797 [Bombyx mandarina]